MGDRLIATISAYKGAPMLIDAILLERIAPTTPPGRQGFLTPMYLVAQRTGRVRLTAGRPPFAVQGINPQVAQQGLAVLGVARM